MKIVSAGANPAAMGSAERYQVFSRASNEFLNQLKSEWEMDNA
jgi:hypothetical protein